MNEFAEGAIPLCVEDDLWRAPRSPRVARVGKQNARLAAAFAGSIVARYKPRLSLAEWLRYVFSSSGLRWAFSMELEAAIHSRRAVRDYSNEPIENATLAGLIDAAIEAPSAINAQSWHFTVIQDRELLRRISSQSKAFVLASPPGGVSREHLQHLLVDSEFDIFYHAPALVLISSIKTGAWAVEDCSLTAENLMLAACGQGLGSCWIGFAQGRLTTAEGKAALGLPSEYLPVAPIIIGRPKSVPLAVRRDKPQIKWTNGYEQQVRIGGAPGAMKLSPRDWLLRGWLFGACCAHTGNDECQRGNDIVQQACSTCHVAGRNQKIAPALGEPVPSFLDIAARPSTTAKSLHDFLLTTHWD